MQQPAEPMITPTDESTSMTPESKSPVFIGILVVLLIIGVISYVSYRKSVSDGTVVEPGAATTTNTRALPAPAVFTTFRDGSYSAKGRYAYHAGTEEITVSLTLKDGIITDTQFQGTPSVPMSQKYMDAFSANYKPMVIGKEIKDLKLGKVSTSSLTPMGFNNALDQIRAQAGS